MSRGDASAAHGRAYGVLAVAVVFFASTWPVSKIALQDATPLWLAVGRAGLSTIAAALLLLARGQLRIPSRADLPIVLTIGTLQLGGFFALTNFGLRFLPAGRSIVFVYTTMLWLVPLSIIAGERVDRWRAAGSILGIGGIAVLCNPAALDWSNGDMLLGTVALLLAALFWAFAIFHARRHRWRMTPLALLPWQMLVATIVLVPFALFLEPGGGIGSEPGTLAALLYLGVVSGPVGTWAATSVARALPMRSTLSASSACRCSGSRSRASGSASRSPSRSPSAPF